VRFANGAEVALQKLGPGVKGYVYDALLSPLWKAERRRGGVALQSIASRIYAACTPRR
jgi:hypothetical protein